MIRACRKRPCRLRAEGPLAPYFEPYSEYLAERGYSQVAYWHKTFLINEFSRWLCDKRIAVGEITAEHEVAFLLYSAKCRRPKRGDPASLSGITRWLRDKCVIESRDIASIGLSGVEAILQEYADWLRDERGLAPSTAEEL
ncbi:hypothetical protein C5748_25305 [Phyllobacterium phragmitis]|uniref:Core-binding (CB) domain-containing protein n=2 Tax=Phyllobacterium phragmitis TaxID=2670329 RepID=A0A2S9IJP9_9HYPH|nr:hypothetical protein C5748_25305 [Phyllobacterium phragmitis]